MNDAHLHLILNHLPVMSFPLITLVVAWGVFRRSREIARFGLGLAVVFAAFTYPVFLTGEPAEEQIEDAAWATETLVEEHEERAEATLIVVLLTGVLAAGALWQSRRHPQLKLTGPVVVLTALLISSSMLGWTALGGGRIRHDEIRNGAAPGAETNETDDRNER